MLFLGVCLVEYESTRNSTAKGGPNWDGSYDWGLFQINDRYWCRPGYPGGVCKITCESKMIRYFHIYFIKYKKLILKNFYNCFRFTFR